MVDRRSMNVNAPQFVPRIRYYIPPPVYYYPPLPPFPPVIPPVPKKDVAVQVGRPMMLFYLGLGLCFISLDEYYNYLCSLIMLQANF